jgi:hypothetical protein
MLLPLLLAATAHAGGMVGVDLVPMGRADLVAVDAGRTSGTFVGEDDGLLRPPLTAWGGVAGDHVAWLGGLGVAWTATTTWAADPAGGEDLVTKRRAATLRPSADVRWYPGGRGGHGVQPWLGGGLHVTAPFVSYRSDAWTLKEQKGWDEVADEDRARLFGWGFRAGGGAELLTPAGVRVGGRYLLGYHQSQDVDEAAIQVTARLAGEAALTLGFDL